MHLDWVPTRFLARPIDDLLNNTVHSGEIFHFYQVLAVWIRGYGLDLRHVQVVTDPNDVCRNSWC